MFLLAATSYQTAWHEVLADNLPATSSDESSFCPRLLIPAVILQNPVNNCFGWVGVQNLSFLFRSTSHLQNPSRNSLIGILTKFSFSIHY